MTSGSGDMQNGQHATRQAPKIGMSLVAPVHLRGADAIAETFTVHRNTVKEWWLAGAPIAVVGGAYCTEYNALMAWLCEKTAKTKKPVN